jgi:hypothetical protein
MCCAGDLWHEKSGEVVRTVCVCMGVGWEGEGGGGGGCTHSAAPVPDLFVGQVWCWCAEMILSHRSIPSQSTCVLLLLLCAPPPQAARADNLARQLKRMEGSRATSSSSLNRCEGCQGYCGVREQQ